MNIADQKGNLHTKGILSLLSNSHYMPTDEKLRLLADRYEADESISAFACYEGAAAVGVIIVKALQEDSYEIVSLAVDPAFRGQGIGSGLIAYAVERLACRQIRAETDADAVGFYRSDGFVIRALGEKHPGTLRYLCTLTFR